MDTPLLFTTTTSYPSLTRHQLQSQATEQQTSSESSFLTSLRTLTQFLKGLIDNYLDWKEVDSRRTRINLEQVLRGSHLPGLLGKETEWAGSSSLPLLTTGVHYLYIETYFCPLLHAPTPSTSHRSTVDLELSQTYKSPGNRVKAQILIQ